MHYLLPPFSVSDLERNDISFCIRNDYFYYTIPVTSPVFFSFINHWFLSWNEHIFIPLNLDSLFPLFTITL